MKRIHWILLGLITLATLALDFFGKPNPHPQVWDKIPLFYALLGFGGCLLIIVMAKQLGRAILQKPEDYYDRDS